MMSGRLNGRNWMEAQGVKTQGKLKGACRDYSHFGLDASQIMTESCADRCHVTLRVPSPGDGPAVSSAPQASLLCRVHLGLK